MTSFSEEAPEETVLAGLRFGAPLSPSAIGGQGSDDTIDTIDGGEGDDVSIGSALSAADAAGDFDIDVDSSNRENAPNDDAGGDDEEEDGIIPRTYESPKLGVHAGGDLIDTTPGNKHKGGQLQRLDRLTDLLSNSSYAMAHPLELDFSGTGAGNATRRRVRGGTKSRGHVGANQDDDDDDDDDDSEDNGVVMEGRKVRSATRKGPAMEVGAVGGGGSTKQVAFMEIESVGGGIDNADPIGGGTNTVVGMEVEGVHFGQGARKAKTVPAMEVEPEPVSAGPGSGSTKAAAKKEEPVVHLCGGISKCIGGGTSIKCGECKQKYHPGCHKSLFPHSSQFSGVELPEDFVCTRCGDRKNLKERLEGANDSISLLNANRDEGGFKSVIDRFSNDFWKGMPLYEACLLGVVPSEDVRNILGQNNEPLKRYTSSHNGHFHGVDYSRSALGTTVTKKNVNKQMKMRSLAQFIGVSLSE